MKKITHEEACRRLQEKGMTLLEEYRGRDYEHKIQCYCGSIHTMYYGNAVSGKGGCSDCFRYNVEFTEERNKCVICETEDNLHVHHLQSYRDFPELRLDVINGIVLCSQHHRKFHSEYGNKDFTRDDFIEFYINKLEEIENVL